MLSKNDIKYTLEANNADYKRILVDDELKIDLVNDTTPYLGNINFIDGIPIDNKENILSNKLSAIISRSEFRNVYDIYVLLKNNKFDKFKIIESLRQKTSDEIDLIYSMLESFPIQNITLKHIDFINQTVFYEFKNEYKKIMNNFIFEKIALGSVSKVNSNLQSNNLNNITSRDHQVTTDKTLSQTYKITNSYEAVSIPMDEILLKLGYEYKKEKCTKKNFTMQNTNGDLIVISRMPNEHYLYFNPFNDNDKGNIHSFCKNRGIFLKDVLYNNVFELKHKLQYSDSKHKDSASIKAVSEFEKFKGIQDSSFLQKRGIDTLIVNAFNIRLDNYNNICFPHFHVIENPFYKKVFLLQSGYTSKLRNPMTKDSGEKL